MNKNNFKIFIFLTISLFSVFSFSKAQNLIACLDTSGNISTTVYDNESCPAGTTTGSPFFLDNNTTTTSGVINTVYNQNTNINTSNINNQISTQTQTSTPISIVTQNPEVVINKDPSLEYGAFVNLDPTEYKYCVLLTKDLYYGSRDSGNGNEVSALQSYLTDRGFLEYGATGYYGRATELAIKKFQYRNEIGVSGNVDSNTRDIIKELTCGKQMVYIDKPVSPSKIVSYPTIKKTTTTSKSTTSSTKSTTVIPTTNSTKSITSTSQSPSGSSYVSVSNNQSSTQKVNTNSNSTAPVLNNNKLSSSSGTMNLSKNNNLYFTFTTSSASPTICISSNTNCSVISNNTKISEGIKGNLYEAINLSGKWSFTLYGNSSWGTAGSKVYIYLKDSATSNTISIYSINILN